MLLYGYKTTINSENEVKFTAVKDPLNCIEKSSKSCRVQWKIESANGEARNFILLIFTIIVRCTSYVIHNKMHKQAIVFFVKSLDMR